MARRMYKGNAVPTALLAPITNASMSFTVASGGGATFPDGSTGSFVVTLDFGSTAGEEKVLCSARSGDTFTVATRGYDSTTATAHAAGGTNTVRHTISAVDLDEANAHINSTTAVHGIADTSLLLTTAAANAAYSSLAGGSVIATSGAAVKGLVVKAAASQTANLLEVQNNSGTLLVAVSAAGVMSATAGGASHLFGNGGTAVSDAVITARPHDASWKGIVVKAVASQTANLAEFQNSSGTVLAAIEPDGVVHISQVGQATLRIGSQATGSVAGGASVGSIGITVNGTNFKIPYYS